MLQLLKPRCEDTFDSQILAEVEEVWHARARRIEYILVRVVVLGVGLVVFEIFVALLILSGVTAAKLFYGPTVPVLSDVFYGGGPLIFDGGAFLFPFVYIIGDILAEVYGWRRARRETMPGSDRTSR